jgi:ubiquitin-conjugating enzyme E2 W
MQTNILHRNQYEIWEILHVEAVDGLLLQAGCACFVLCGNLTYRLHFLSSVNAGRGEESLSAELLAMMHALYILTALVLSSSSARASFPATLRQQTVVARHHNRGDVSILESAKQHSDRPSIILGKNCVIDRALGRLAFIHRYPAANMGKPSAVSSHINLSTTKHNQLQSALSIRGGASSNKVQSIIQSILDSSLPEPIKRIILMICKLLEDLTGFDILPQVETKKSKAGKLKAKDVLIEEVSSKRKGGKSRQSKCRKSEVEDDANVASPTTTKSVAADKKVDESANDESEAEDATENESKDTTITTPTPSKPKKTDAASKKFLSNNLKSSNPNYRIQRELKEFISSPPPGLSVKISGKNVRLWIITLTMPQNTIYAGEVYKLRVQFPSQYPTVPPSVYFLPPTPRHEHVYTNGDICLSLLGKDWRPIMTAQSLAQAIMSILCGAQRKSLPMDNSRHAGNKPGQRQDDWVYHDDNC